MIRARPPKWNRLAGVFFAGLICSASAGANTLSVVPNTIGGTAYTNVQANDLLSFDIVLDLSDDDVAGGAFNISWAPEFLSFVSSTTQGALTIFAPIEPTDPFDLGVPGSLFDWNIAPDINSSSPALPTGETLLGTLTLQVIGALGSESATITGNETGVAGWFNLDFDQVSVNYSPTTVTSVVPLPAAVWLFGSGLLAMFGFSRRRRTPTPLG